MGLKIENKNGYNPIPSATRVKIMVEVFLDPVPGVCHEVEDHLNLILMNNCYALSAEVVEVID